MWRINTYEGLVIDQAFFTMRMHMENTVQNKKNSIEALARIVADMQQVYMIAQNIEQM